MTPPEGTSHSCHGGVSVEAPPGARKIVLVGNPNVGKSLFFNAFTGLYVDVSNFPGTTVTISSGRMGDDVVLDTPGVYGVSSFNDEEIVARDIIMEADVVVNVVDAVHLERDLFLTQQVLDMGLPTVVALNMIDEAEARDTRIDAEELSDRLGVPVVPTVAIVRKGFDQVRAAIDRACPGVSDPLLRDRMLALLDRVGTLPEALLVLEGDPYIAERHGVEAQGLRDEIYLDRRRRVNELVARVVERRGEGLDLRLRLGQALLRPLLGFPMLAAVLFVMYEIIGVFVAQTVVGFTEGSLMQGYVEPAIRTAVATVVGPEGVVYELLAGEFGVLTLTITYILGLLLPLVIGFYVMLSLLEDSGYLPRIAALADRAMTAIGLNGRAIIPMILGFGCITMATITTRILGNERERKIATALMAFAIPCSAQLGVITALLAAAGGPAMAALYVAVMVLVFGVIGLGMARYLPGSSTDLLIDLPPLRLPRPVNVLTKTYHKTVMFIREVSLYFAVGALLLGVLQVSGALVAAQDFVAPLTERWLLLPREAATAFIMGFVRRDFGAAGLYSLGLSGTSVLVALVTITLFVPCIASVLVIMKERGRVFTAFTWAGSLVLAFGVGGILAHAVSWV
ncbi:MAG: ferrous iron transport protein B [Thermoleophilia bacterium]|nr:ferrous iron transport protein B [Thermoleophilia bacterium]